MTACILTKLKWFAWLPVESLVHQQQAAYYQALSESTAATDGAPFIRFMLGCIQEAVTPVEMSVETPVEKRKTPQRILQLLRDQPGMTLAEVAQATGLSQRTVERAAKKLQQAGQLRHHAPKKGGHWEVVS